MNAPVKMQAKHFLDLSDHDATTLSTALVR